ncbi:MAG: DUF2798 domain-containing protein [Azonexaceae bacterium]|uniref:DUF2798 domain-containing protein n=1 Tax=Azonexus sp. R2A61 TaxID=2744443 RepID=UPI001F44DAD3|nr:DUF2798 domain-containing protein [Azonexus sp. R2A61]MCE1238566.1 DUF2798 domain-containing protein [Azonexaceae bacterium]
MRIDPRYANLLFSFLLSGIMSCIVSGVVLVTHTELSWAFPLQWASGFMTTWPIAFPSVLFLAPRVRRVVNRLTRE